jgi:hemerythrin-like domain-containing protein
LPYLVGKRIIEMAGAERRVPKRAVISETTPRETHVEDRPETDTINTDTVNADTINTETIKTDGVTIDAIEILEQEHALIERVLDLLDQSRQMIAAGGTLPTGFAPWVVSFFREFADHRHHAKEEAILFPLLESRGLARDGGPTGVMIHEHELGRDCVGRMDGAAAATPPDLAAFAAAAAEYGSLLSQHIFKENNVLFQMARQILAVDDLRSATERFAVVEAELGGTESRHTWQLKVEQWEAAFRDASGVAQD